MRTSDNHQQPAYGTGITLTAGEPIATRTTGHVDLTIMLAMHDAFRRDLVHLARAADRHPADLENPARRTALLAGWELFKAQLHHHHTAEDAGLWPRMRTHLAERPGDLAMLQAMEDEHGRIDPLLAAIDDAFADRDHGHHVLRNAVDALATVLPQHLDHEERDALPLMAQVLTAEEPRRCSRGCWTTPRPSRPRQSSRRSRRRCGWSTAGSGDPATLATTTGRRRAGPGGHEYPLAVRRCGTDGRAEPPAAAWIVTRPQGPRRR
jgi:iron-sulfur cluster repair protein YtfE (RIC family)